MKKIIVLALSTVFLVGAFAVAAPASAVTLQELQNQIQSLLNQVKNLQTQNQTAAVVETIADSSTWCFTFKQNLRKGDIGGQVARLQTTLEKEGFTIRKLEKQSNEFGDSTKSAVIGFQNKYKEEILTPIDKTSGTGFVGETTRAKLNQLYGCNTATAALATIPPPVSAVSTTVPTSNTDSSSPGETTTTTTTVPRPPHIDSISPSSGPIGTKVSLNADGVLVVTKNIIKLGLISIIADPFPQFPSGGTVTFTVPQNGPSSCTTEEVCTKDLIQITPGIYDVKVVNTLGESNAVKFEVTDSTVTPSITVVSPNGGEKWQIGSMHTITWTPYEPGCKYPDEPYCDSANSINPADSVTAHLEQLIPGINQFIGVGRIAEGGKASLHWDGITLLDYSGKYLDATPGDYYIRLVNNATGASDRSDNAFKLMPRNSVTADLKLNGSDGPIKVPEGGANYTASWTSNADTCYIYNDTLPWPDNFTGNLAPSGKRTIKLMPNTETYDKNVSVSCQSKSGIEGYAWDNVLVLPSAAAKFSAKITSPNGGELFNYNSWNLITYQTSGVETVSLALYKNNKFFAWIVKDKPNYKGTSWNNHYLIPSDIISQDKIGKNVFKIYMIGKKSGARGTVTDISDKPFTISN